MKSYSAAIMAIDAMCLTAPQMRAAVQHLEGVSLTQSTLNTWLDRGLVKASIRRDGIRGRAHPVIFSFEDLARVRLVARLRRAGRWSPERVRQVLADPDLQRALRPKSDLQIVITKDRVLVQSRKDAAAAAMQAGLGQFVFRFPAAELFTGNAEVVKRITKGKAA